MARLASLAKAGYFRTPDRVTQLITNYLGRPEEKGAQVAFYGRLIDPCAGTGTAAQRVADHLGVDSFGIELDAHRWLDAQRTMTKALHLDYNSARVSRETFSVLYLNPPYDISDDKDSKRLEFEFLKDTSDWLAPGGILVYIIPQPQFNPRVMRWLTSHYSGVSIYRFPDPEYSQFKQVVAFGIKKESFTRDEDAEQALNKALRVEFGVNLLPVLGARVHQVYTIPAVDPSDKFVFRSSEISPDEALKEAKQNGAWYGKNWHNWLSPHKAEKFTPLMPLKKGHLAMLIASGMMQNIVLEQDGEIGEPSQRIVVKGRTFKIVKKSESADGEEERATDVFITEIVSLDLKTGEMQRLNDPISLGAFIDKWQAVLTEKVMGSYEPLYQFDYSADAPILNSLSLHRRLPGREETGLFEAQKHISSAMATHFRNGRKSAILVGEMGAGKSSIGTSIIAALGQKANPALILCPPHLTVKWLREIREIVPNAFAMELTHFRDVDKFFKTVALQPEGVQCFAVVSRERAKLGSGWRAAYRIKKIGHRDPFDDTVSTSHVFVCPRCGGIVTDDDGAIVTKTDYFERKRFCTEVEKTTNRECGEPLWQATHFNGEEGSIEALGSGKTGERKTRYPIADYIYRKYNRRFKFFIGDECFPAGTRISTPNGDVPIEKIQVGDFVTSYQGGATTLKRVVRTIAKPRSQELVRVKHAYGEVICTPNHKFCTENGYVPASQLMNGTQLILISNESYPMPSMRKPIHSNPHKTKRSVENMQRQMWGQVKSLGGQGSKKATPQDRCAKNLHTMWQGICAQLPATQPSYFLRQVMFRQVEMGKSTSNARNWGQDQIGATTTARIGTDEKKQPKPQPGSQSANDRIYEGPMVRTTGWQWNRTDNTPIYVTRLDRLSVGASDCDRQSQVDMCGAGPGKPHPKNCHRSRWAHSQSSQAKDERQNQGTDAQRTGLDGSALYKPTSDQSDTSSSACYQRCRESPVISVNPSQSQEEWVYDLEVEDTHCYFANGVLVSNCHELKHQSSDQGYAFGTLVRACHRTLGMTGTLYGGYASSIFFILYRLFPKFRKEYGWRESQDFVARYGVLERVTKFSDGDDGYGHYSGRRRSKTYVRELPGSSPELAMLLLDSTCFLSLQDLGFDLPPFEEFPRVINMENKQQGEYTKLDDFMRSEVKQRMQQGDKSLLAAYLQSTLGYPNACFRQNDVTDKYGKVIYVAPKIADTVFPKEYELLKLVNREKKEGRRLIVFCRQTGTRDITERIVSVLAESQIRATVLPSSVAASRREEWINRHVKEGVQVLITNPNLVKTGLDLIAFPTIVFYEMDYSIYTMQQAARRSWRLGQTEDVRVFYFVYDGTMEHRAMALVGAKWNAAEMLVGDSVAAALAQESDGGGSFLQELARNVIQNAPVDDLQSLFRQRSTAKRDDYIGFDKLPAPIPAPPIPIFLTPVAPPPTYGQQLSLF